MPPRWPRQPSREDSDYRRLDDRMNFAVNVAAFSAINSGCWFFRIVQKADWSWTTWLTLSWLLILIAHGIYIFVIANYSVKSNG